MTSYELLFLCASPGLPVLGGLVRRDLKRILKTMEGGPARVLDVGGRKSPYTIGLAADITVLDLPRETNLQRELHLGINEEIRRALKRRRSNIGDVWIGSLTGSNLPENGYDLVACVEVIEHVLEDRAFVAALSRVVKPGGWLYLTTPNGDYIRNEPPNYNPDHVRHYTREALSALLADFFREVEMRYAVRTGKFRVRGQRSLDLRHPLRTAESMLCNVVNRFESRNLDREPRRTAHLLATARK